MYYIQSASGRKEFATKELLLNYLHPDKELRYYGHNPNDTVGVDNGYYRYNEELGTHTYIPIREHYYISFIIYDEYNRVVSLPEIKEELGNHTYVYKRRLPTYNFTFRYDPVPNTSLGYLSKGYYRKVKRGKREYGVLVETRDLGRSKVCSDKRELLESWGDDHPRTIQKSWKAQSKKKKQYM